jgi:hypothetical protein
MFFIKVLAALGFVSVLAYFGVNQSGLVIGGLLFFVIMLMLKVKK